MSIERLQDMIGQLRGHALTETASRDVPARAPSRAQSWGWVPALSLTSASGLLLLAMANSSARLEFEWAPALMYAGLTLLFVPVAARLFSAAPARRERIGLVVVLGLSLYLVPVLRSPVMLTGYDELLHWRTAYDIIESGHLFHGNSLLPMSPLYPGLEIVTSAVIRLTGLPIFEAGVLVIGFARLLFALALFLFFEEISESPRVAGIATLLYMTNPSFVFFDAQFGYESLALPLGVFGLYIITRRLRRHETHHGATLAVFLTIGAIVVTHHLTSFALVVFLAVMFMLGFLTKQSAEERADLGRILAFSIMTVLAWLILIAPTVIYYLSPYSVGAVRQMIDLLLNQVGARPLFTDYAGLGTPLWERLLSLTSVALILLGLPWGLVQIWRRYREQLIVLARGAVSLTFTQVVESNPGISVIALALGAASLVYGVMLPLRLLPKTAEVSARSAEFLFLAIAFVLALGPAQRWLPDGVNWKRIAAVTLWATILFVGGFILGAGPPWARLPGPYLVSADRRSIEPEGIAAANWALTYLGSGNRVAADRVNSLLMGSYGLQRPITDVNDQLGVSPMYFSSEFGKEEEAILAEGNIRYVIVDRRLSTGLPRIGVYFEPVEPLAYEHKIPISQAVLAKFDRVANLSRVFDSGDIVIYEAQVAGGLRAQP